MFELLANYKDLQTITWTQTSATASGGPYGCMPTYSNWNCVVHPAPSACPRPAAARAPPRQAMARACVRIAAGGVMCWDRSGSRIKTMSGGRRVRRLRGRLEEGLDGAAGGRRLRVLGPPGVRPRHGQRRLPVGRVSCGRYRAGLARPAWRGPATAAAAGASAVLQRGKLGRSASSARLSLAAYAHVDPPTKAWVGHHGFRDLLHLPPACRMVPVLIEVLAVTVAHSERWSSDAGARVGDTRPSHSRPRAAHTHAWPASR